MSSDRRAGGNEGSGIGAGMSPSDTGAREAGAAALVSGKGLVAGYGNKKILDDVNFTVSPGEIVAVIGHNGAGKSTLLKSVFGLVRLWSGDVLFEDKDISSAEPRELIRRGVAYVPQGNNVFRSLSVAANLDVAAVTVRRDRSASQWIEHVLATFPALRNKMHRRAGTLSGGEKQMLALANALITRPRMLLLDEPSLGLAPALVTRTLSQIRQICTESDIACLVVEQKVREVLKIADRVYVLRNGAVSFTGAASELSDTVRLRDVYL